jgi:hypothetical protein
VQTADDDLVQTADDDLVQTAAELLYTGRESWVVLWPAAHRSVIAAWHSQHLQQQQK